VANRLAKRHGKAMPIEHVVESSLTTCVLAVRERGHTQAYSICTHVTLLKSNGSKCIEDGIHVTKAPSFVARESCRGFRGRDGPKR
jgi:hypothetical protein